MCTRFYFDNSIDELDDYFERAAHSPIGQKFARELAKTIKPGEIRPTDVVPVLAPSKNGGLDIFAMKWGFMIRPAQSSNAETLIVNARTETASEKISFKESWAKRRCIIPCAWYFEWKHVKNPSTGKTETREKYMIRPTDSGITYLAGLYRIENGYPVFVVLTTAPSAGLAEIHDRMPLLLPKGQIENWIRPESNPADLLSFALKDTVMEPVS